MRQEDLIVEARKLLGHLKNRTTALADDIYRNPVTDYTCEKQAEHERELFFRKGAFTVGLSALLPNPGDWMTHDYAGVATKRASSADSSMSAAIAAPASLKAAAAVKRISAAPITAGAMGSMARSSRARMRLPSPPRRARLTG